MRKFALSLALGTLVLASSHALAEQESTSAYKAAMDDMMMAMMQPATGMADADFATGMIPHHQGAIAMAEVELKFGKDKELLALAQRIKDAQSGEITQMKKWLASPAAKAGKASDEAAKQAGADMEKMMQDMGAPYTGDADIDFAAGMVPHHQGAVAMAETELKFGTDPEIKALAERIKAAQGPEIEQMQKWLSAHKAK